MEENDEINQFMKQVVDNRLKGYTEFKKHFDEIFTKKTKKASWMIWNYVNMIEDYIENPKTKRDNSVYSLKVNAEDLETASDDLKVVFQMLDIYFPIYHTMRRLFIFELMLRSTTEELELSGKDEITALLPADYPPKAFEEYHKILSCRVNQPKFSNLFDFNKCCKARFKRILIKKSTGT